MKRLAIGATLLVLGLQVSAAFATDNSRVDGNVSIPPAGSQTLAPCTFIINGILGSGSSQYPSTSGLQTGRLNRNGVASTCAVPKTCNQFDSTPGRAYDAYVFTNNGGAVACVSVNLVVNTQAACNLQPNAYLGSYNPNSICTNYLADPGLSSGIPPTPVNFSFNVNPGDSFVVPVHTTNPGEIGCDYTLTVSGDICGATPVEPTRWGMIKSIYLD